MRENTLPDAGPKRKLFDAAAQLFAEKGFEAVSVRDITRLTGANIAAVNYHFGSRDGLLALIMTHHLIPLTEERLDRLEMLERKWSGKTVPLEEVIDAYVRPLLTQVRKADLSEASYCKLIGRSFSIEGEILPAAVQGLLVQTIDRFMRMFGKALPTLAVDEIQWRMHFIAGGLVHLLTLAPQAVPFSLESALGRFIRYAAAGMRDGLQEDVAVKAGPQAMFDF